MTNVTPTSASVRIFHNKNVCFLETCFQILFLTELLIPAHGHMQVDIFHTKISLPRVPGVACPGYLFGPRAALPMYFSGPRAASPGHAGLPALGTRRKHRAGSPRYISVPEAACPTYFSGPRAASLGTQGYQPSVQDGNSGLAALCTFLDPGLLALGTRR